MTQTLPEIDVLIVGAGPTGLMMASEAARRGLSCRLVEKAAEPNPWSRALGVQARTLELLTQMGLADAAVARGHKAHGARVHADGQERAHITFDGLDSPFPYVLILPQNKTEALLADRVGAQGVTIERGTELIAFTQDDAGVTATLRQQDGRETTARARWLVGADGAHSAVRHGLGLPFEGAAYPEGFLLADCRLSGSLPEDALSVYLTHDGFLAIFPFGGGLFRLIGSLPGDAAAGTDRQPDAATLEECQAMMDTRGPGGVTLNDPVWLSRFRLHRRLAPQMRVGRVFLAGDAAHIHSPAGGQGMNTGIQDAFNLAWKLALTAQGAAPDALLDSYQAERHPIAEGVLRDTDLAMHAVTLHNRGAEAVRDWLLSEFSGLDAVKRRLRADIAELSVGYRHSPVVEDAGGDGPLRAGDRVPNTPLREWNSGAATSLLAVLADTRHTLWLLAGPSPSKNELRALAELRQRVEAHNGAWVAVHLVLTETPPDLAWNGSVYLDPGGALHARFGGAPALCLIRPDSYLGFRGRAGDAERLRAYLERLFSAGT